MIRYAIIFFIVCLCSVVLADSPMETILQDSNQTDSPNSTHARYHPQYIQITPDSKEPVFRYQNENISPDIKGIIDYIDFQTTNNEKGQVYIYFSLPTGDASINQTYAVADFIMQQEKWIGDRSRNSVAAEIYVHWIAENAKPLFMTDQKAQALYQSAVIGTGDIRPSPIHPTHLGYYYAGLHDTDPLEAFLKSI